MVDCEMMLTEVNMKKLKVSYAVIESDSKGIKRDLSHFLFQSYDEACRFSAEMNEKNADDAENYKFQVITLTMR